MLLLDEPLAGLDWRARMEVAETLKLLKKECTILVVSHDLRELSPLVTTPVLATLCLEVQSVGAIKAQQSVQSKFLC